MNWYERAHAALIDMYKEGGGIDLSDRDEDTLDAIAGFTSQAMQAHDAWQAFVVGDATFRHEFLTNCLVKFEKSAVIAEVEMQKVIRRHTLNNDIPWDDYKGGV